MRKDRAARLRTATEPGQAEPIAADPRIRVDLPHLRSLEGRLPRLRLLPRQPARSILNGRHASRLRGRGLDFEELREYLPSDDVRTIDWKVTARTGKTHVRVFTEERDRPTLLVVDQRMSMFFGSVLNMKSVTAAECAALAAFGVLEQGDRLGGIVFGDSQLAEIRPRRSRAALDAFLTALADANSLLHADAPPEQPMPMNNVLESVARIAKHDHLVVILSDFDEIDDETERHLSGIARHNDLLLALVSDPYAQDIPKGARFVVSDGELQAEIDTRDTTTHRRLAEAASGRLARILDWQRTLGLTVLPLSSAEDSVLQIQQLLGLAGRRRR